jgi:hypothetical protein
VRYKVTCFDENKNIKSHEYFNRLNDCVIYAQYNSDKSFSIELSWYRKKFLTNEMELIVHQIKINDNKLVMLNNPIYS